MSNVIISRSNVTSTVSVDNIEGVLSVGNGGTGVETVDELKEVLGISDSSSDWPIGEVRTFASTRSDLGEDYILCDGSFIYCVDYPNIGDSIHNIGYDKFQSDEINFSSSVLDITHNGELNAILTSTQVIFTYDMSTVYYTLTHDISLNSTSKISYDGTRFIIPVYNNTDYNIYFYALANTDILTGNFSAVATYKLGSGSPSSISITNLLSSTISGSTIILFGYTSSNYYLAYATLSAANATKGSYHSSSMNMTSNRVVYSECTDTFLYTLIDSNDDETDMYKISASTLSSSYIWESTSSSYHAYYNNQFIFNSVPTNIYSSNRYTYLNLISGTSVGTVNVPRTLLYYMYVGDTIYAYYDSDSIYKATDPTSPNLVQWDGPYSMESCTITNIRECVINGTINVAFRTTRGLLGEESYILPAANTLDDRYDYIRVN